MLQLLNIIIDFFFTLHIGSIAQLNLMTKHIKKV